MYTIQTVLPLRTARRSHPCSLSSWSAYIDWLKQKPPDSARGRLLLGIQRKGKWADVFQNPRSPSSSTLLPVQFEKQVKCLYRTPEFSQGLCCWGWLWVWPCALWVWPRAFSASSIHKQHLIKRNWSSLARPLRVRVQHSCIHLNVNFKWACLAVLLTVNCLFGFHAPHGLHCVLCLQLSLQHLDGCCLLLDGQLPDGCPHLHCLLPSIYFRDGCLQLHDGGLMLLELLAMLIIQLKQESNVPLEVLLLLCALSRWHGLPETRHSSQDEWCMLAWAPVMHGSQQ